MISALGHCEDPACSQNSTSHELVRLFRCSIHCDRLLCLFHLNSHNVYYEEEKKQNDAVLNELQNSLTLYQTIFEQHIQSYRELVHQASTLLLHNTSTIIPIEQIRPILEKLQRAIAIFQQEKVIIKSEPVFDGTVEFDVDSSLLKDTPPIKKEINTPTPNTARNVVVRLNRIDCSKELHLESRLNEEQTNKSTLNEKSKDSDAEIAVDSISPIPDENQQSRTISPASSGQKKSERVKKKNDKITPLKRLQT